MEREEKTKVYTKPNGPVIISGDFELEQEDGTKTIEKRVAICRCANSGKMPYCDGSHNRVGFQSC
jgi:CDGSH-type Zn-finger protein